MIGRADTNVTPGVLAQAAIPPDTPTDFAYGGNGIYVLTTVTLVVVGAGADRATVALNTNDFAYCEIPLGGALGHSIEVHPDIAMVAGDIITVVGFGSATTSFVLSGYYWAPPSEP